MRQFKHIAAIVFAIMLGVTLLPMSGVTAADKPALSSASVSVLQNGTKTVKINANGYTIKSIKIQTSKKSVAKATATKKAITIYGIKKGSAKITVTVRAKKGKNTKTFKLTTKANIIVPGASIKTTNLNVGKTTQVTVSNAVKGSKITYVTTNKKVATVSSKGVVKGISAGRAVIRVKITLPKTKYANKKTLTISVGRVIVSNIAVTNVSLNKTSLDLYQGSTAKLQTTVKPSNTTLKTTTWMTSNANVATVSNGTVKAVAPGTATIIAACGGKNATCKVTVTLDPANPTAIVTTQEDLETSLANENVRSLTISGTAEYFNIPQGTYTNIDLIVDAPKATITNAGVFKSIKILSVSADSWKEKAVGNEIEAQNTSDIRIALGEYASIKNLKTLSGTTGKVSVDMSGGCIENIEIASANDVNLKLAGTAKINSLKVVSKAKVEVNATETSEIETVTTSGAGAYVPVTAGGESKVGTIAVTKEAGTETGIDGAVQTAIVIKAVDKAEIKSVTTAAENTNLAISTDGKAKVISVKAEAATYFIVTGSNTTNTMKIEVTKDAGGTMVESSAKIEVSNAATGTEVFLDDGAGGTNVITTDKEATTKIQNKSGKNVFAKDYFGRWTTIKTDQTGNTTEKGTEIIATT